MKLRNNVCNRCHLVCVKFYLNLISFAVVSAKCLGGSLFWDTLYIWCQPSFICLLIKIYYTRKHSRDCKLGTCEASRFDSNANGRFTGPYCKPKTGHHLGLCWKSYFVPKNYFRRLVWRYLKTQSNYCKGKIFSTAPLTVMATNHNHDGHSNENVQN